MRFQRFFILLLGGSILLIVSVYKLSNGLSNKHLLSNKGMDRPTGAIKTKSQGLTSFIKNAKESAIEYSEKETLNDIKPVNLKTTSSKLSPISTEKEISSSEIPSAELETKPSTKKIFSPSSDSIKKVKSTTKVVKIPPTIDDEMSTEFLSSENSAVEITSPTESRISTEHNWNETSSEHDTSTFEVNTTGISFKSANLSSTFKVDQSTTNEETLESSTPSSISVTGRENYSTEDFTDNVIFDTSTTSKNTNMSDSTVEVTSEIIETSESTTSVDNSGNPSTEEFTENYISYNSTTSNSTEEEFTENTISYNSTTSNSTEEEFTKNNISYNSTTSDSMNSSMTSSNTEFSTVSSEHNYSNTTLSGSTSPENVSTTLANNLNTTTVSSKAQTSGKLSSKSIKEISTTHHTNEPKSTPSSTPRSNNVTKRGKPIKKDNGGGNKNDKDKDNRVNTFIALGVTMTLVIIIVAIFAVWYHKLRLKYGNRELLIQLDDSEIDNFITFKHQRFYDEHDSL